MKVYVSKWVTFACPSCDYILIRDGPRNLLFCGNSHCEQHLKKYRVPSFELEPVEQAEQAEPA